MHAQPDETGMTRRAVDAGIAYPCYKSLDEFVDVERLKLGLGLLLLLGPGLGLAALKPAR